MKERRDPGEDKEDKCQSINQKVIMSVDQDFFFSEWLFCHMLSATPALLTSNMLMTSSFISILPSN